jgi:beta-galactosidase beta subunit
MIIQEYNTKEIKDCVLEGHVKYIDIQYIIQGVELMGVTTKKNQKQ